MTTTELQRLQAYSTAKRYAPTMRYTSRRSAKSSKFTTARFNPKNKRIHKRLVISLDALGL